MLKAKSVNLRSISTYRTELMGLAATMIIICHAPANGVLMPTVLEKVLRSWGGLGVDIFLFLSGVGMYYSLQKRVGMKGWYYHRYTRILVPYLVLSIPYYLFHWIVDGGGILIFLENISTISFYTRHEGAWFVAFLIPLYFLTPWIARVIKHINNARFYVFLICILLSVLGIIPFSNGLINNIQVFFRHAPAYILGYWIGKYVYESKVVTFYRLINYLIVVLVLYVVFMYIKMPKNWLIIVPLLLVVIFFIDNTPNSYTNNFLGFMGKISLESYLLNIYLPVVLRKLGYLKIMRDYDPGNYIFYFIVITFGILFAYLGHLVSQSILKR